MNTLFWYDYETFGVDTRSDRIAQFAGLRTDEQLAVVDTEVSAYCCIPDDYLPDPHSCLLTGITPQQTLREGVPEAEFAQIVHRQLARANTCSAGYNSIRFDDEFTRFLLYRNFYDPYAREWRDGNSRWDLIDAMRLAHALRPEGIEWPLRDDGTASFRLEELTAANGLEHSAAHDAMSDVRATVATARLLRARQPRLFDFVYRHRDRRSAAKLLDMQEREMVLHVSSKYPARLGCIALVVPLCVSPRNPREVVVFDLRQDPQVLLQLSAEDIAARLFTSSEELGEDVERVALKTVRLNRAPVIAPANTLRADAAERWSIDVERSAERLMLIESHADEIAAKLSVVFQPPVTECAPVEPEAALYEGFLNDADRDLLPRVHTAETAAQFNELAGLFEDHRLRDMVFHYRARNRPATLDARDRARWQQHRSAVLLQGQGERRTLRVFRESLGALEAAGDLSADQRRVLAQLGDYANDIAATIA